MMPTLPWMIAAIAALLACGCLAGAWFYRRRIAELQQQMKAVRHAAAEHASQARRQIGQLQAELAKRPPLRSATEPAKAEAAPKSAPAAAAARARLPEDDHVPIVIGRSGFAETQVME